jgi:hypothetical protein
MSLIEKWKHYTETRRGTYEFRARTRYRAVADRLFAMGLHDAHSLLDAGAGTCQFGRYLQERGWYGEYVPVDAVVCGTDLERWHPTRQYDFCVSIETVEHLQNPFRLIRALRMASRLGTVITTPNCDAVDVIGCDPTHVSIVPGRLLAREGFNVERHTWFGVFHDSLLAWRQNA